MKSPLHLVTVVAALLLAAFSTRSQADVFGYAVSLSGDLHYVNLNTGTYTGMGPLTPASAAVPAHTGHMQALAMAPGGELIGVDEANVLYLIDKTAGTLLKATPLPATVTRLITGLDYDETRKLFVAIAGGLPGSSAAIATDRWDLTISLPALTVTTAAGPYTVISTPPSGGMQSVAWLAAPPTDRLWMTSDGGGPTSFITGALLSGPWSFGGAPGGSFRGMDRAADGLLYAIGIHLTIWQMDPVSGATLNAVSAGHMNEWTSLACEVPQCVEITAYAGVPTPWRNSFAQPVSYSGMVTSVAGNVVGSHAGAFGAGPFLGAGYMMEVIAGPGAGLCSEVIENTASDVFLADDLSASLVVGSSVIGIRRSHTLASLFPGGAGLSPFEDLIVFKDPGGSTRNYMWDGTDWVNPVDLLPAGTVPVRPCQEICFLTPSDRILRFCGYPVSCRCPAFPALYATADCPCDGKWHLKTTRVRTAWLAATPLNNISDAMNIALTATAGAQFACSTSTSSVLNHTDPFTAKNNAPTTFCEKKALPGVLGWKDTDKMVVQAETKIVITGAEAGLWTFGIRADDGFAFRLLTCPPVGPGVPLPWTAVSGAGNALDPGNVAVVHALPTADSNCHAVINLPAGIYCAQFVWFERAGAAHFELYAGRGAFPTGPDPWRLVGYRAQNTVNSCWPCMQNWIVTTSARGITPMGSLSQAEAAVINFPFPPIAYPDINFRDFIQGGPSIIGGLLPSPANTDWPNNPAGPTNINFGMKAIGWIYPPCDGDFLIGFRGDDGAKLTLESCLPSPHLPAPVKVGALGTTFTDPPINAGCNNTAGIRYNLPTGSAGVAGIFSLKAPGPYPVTLLYRQQTGGCAIEVFTKPASWKYYCPRLLGADTCALGPDRHGITLCRQNLPRIAYPAWAQSNPALLADPAADPDHDGWENRAEFAAGTNALAAASVPQMQSGIAALDMDEPGGPSRFQTLSILRSATADASVTGVSSPDLDSFEEAIHLSTEDLGNGLLRETWRAPGPVGEASRSYISIRLREEPD